EFYKNIFLNLGIPHAPFGWGLDRNPFFLSEDQIREQKLKEAKVIQLINAYRVRGHLLADTDPLHALPLLYHPELDIETYGLTIWDLDRVFITDGLANREHDAARDSRRAATRLLWQGRHRVSPHSKQRRETMDSRTDSARVCATRTDSR